MSTVEKSMGRTVDITTLPNHINNEHVHIFRWLDGCGWTIKCGNIHIESNNIEDAIMDFLKFTSEVLKYNPNFDYHINRLWTTTLIKDFDGEVEYYIDDAEGEAHIIGTGNVNFFTTQTGY